MSIEYYKIAEFSDHLLFTFILFIHRFISTSKGISWALGIFRCRSASALPSTLRNQTKCGLNLLLSLNLPYPLCLLSSSFHDSSPFPCWWCHSCASWSRACVWLVPCLRRRVRAIRFGLWVWSEVHCSDRQQSCAVLFHDLCSGWYGR